MSASADHRTHVLSLRSVDAANLNAQHVTTREILCRLPPDRFRVTAFVDGTPDARLADREHVRLVPLARRGRTLRCLRTAVADPPDLLLHPNPDVYDTRIERLLQWLRPSVGLAVHVVLTVDPERTPARDVERLRRQVARARVLTANGTGVADSVEATLGRRPLVVANGVDRSVFRAAPAAPTAPVVAVVASFQARKRHDLVLEAAFRHPEVRFWCAGAGPGPLRASIEASIRERGLRNVAVLDAMPQPALATRLAASTVLFHPSEHEGAPQVALQAQACGCVPIVRRAYCPPSLAYASEELTADDDPGLLERLDAVLRDPALLARHRDAGLRAADEHSWDRIAPRWAGLLGSVAP
jgi:glycosyltransferase involved in cell wall biosynthesis